MYIFVILFLYGYLDILVCLELLLMVLVLSVVIINLIFLYSGRKSKKMIFVESDFKVVFKKWNKVVFIDNE